MVHHCSSDPSYRDYDIVAVAASAGGIAAMMRMFADLPSDFPVAVVVVQHIVPSHRSYLASILSRRIVLSVKEAEHGEQICPSTIYIAPPDHHLLVTARHTISLTQSELVHFVRPSADLLFESVAACYKERAIAVLLTGSGSDGAMGVTAIKKMGGTVIVQDSATAEFPGMPNAAIKTGKADLILSLDKIASTLIQLVTSKGHYMNESESDSIFQGLLDYLKHNRGFDFSGYKQQSLIRRVNKRLSVIGLTRFDEYVDYLEVHPEEFANLFNTLIINVTEFFRDQHAWSYLNKEILPHIIANKSDDEYIRIWSAGCASGEEAYSIAILLVQYLGIDVFRQRVKIYATDIDDDALATARQASYVFKDMETVSDEQRDSYFEHNSGMYIFRSDLRRSVIFGRHDLVLDAPISRLDLLICRNVLMYFNAETQARILSRFHFALKDTGYMFLGKAEMMLTHAKLFTPVELKHRIFQRNTHTDIRTQIRALTQMSETGNHLARNVQLRESAFQASPFAQVVIDTEGLLVLANEQARALLNLGLPDIGRPLHDLEASYRPVEVRSLIEQAYKEKRAIVVEGIKRHQPNGDIQYLNVQVVPLYENGGDSIGVCVNFVDVTPYNRLMNELQRSRHDVETAYEELQSTNEELETTNEELQSTIEELETTNEELQSTNEELETMNEELQSTNEEMHTVNEELEERTNELNKTNAFLESIFTGLRAGVVVLDTNLSILIWNHRAEDLWGLRRDEVEGQFFLNLDIGLPVQELKGMLRMLLDSEIDYHEMTLDSVFL